MGIRPSERFGLLILRAWIEQNAATALRVRITQTSDMDPVEQTLETAATIEDVLLAVRAWLDALIDSNSSG